MINIIKAYNSLSINVVNKYRNSLDTKDKGDALKLDFGVMPEVLREEYLDMYDRIQSEVVNTTRFNENLDLSTAYLGRSDRAKRDKLMAEESFPISEQGYTLGKLLDGTECQLLLDTGTSDVNHFILCQNLHQRHKEFR